MGINLYSGFHVIVGRRNFLSSHTESDLQPPGPDANALTGVRQLRKREIQTPADTVVVTLRIQA